MTLDEQTEVLGLLDVRVTVLEQAHRPRVRIEGTVPHTAAGGRTLISPLPAVSGVPFKLVA